MKFRWSAKTLGAALMTALALSGFVAAAAHAGLSPRWKVAGAFLAKEKSFEGTSTEKVLLTVPGLSLKIEIPKPNCGMTGKIVGSGALTPGTDKEVVLKCTKAVVVEPAGGVCAVQSVGQAGGTILTNKLKSTLVWLSEANLPAGHPFAAEAGAEIGKIEVLGAGCAAKGTYAIEKEMIGEFNPIGEETMGAALTLKEPATLAWWNNAEPRVKQTSTQLTVGGKAATLRGVFSFALNPAENFGILAG
jgi:hypothetical protein